MGGTNPKSIDETLSELYDELTEEETEEEVEEESEEETEEEVEETEEEDEGDESDSDDDSGTDSPDSDDEPDPEPDAVDEIEEENKNPPTTWTAEAKSKWKDLPPWAKREVHKRERDAINGVNNLKEKASFADRLQRTVLPYQPLLNSLGVTPERALNDALNLAHSLKTGTPAEKANIIRSIAQQYGVDLGQVRQEAPNEVARYIQPLQNEIAQIRRERDLQREQQRQLEESRAIEEANRLINEFAKETDENGELSHPYFHNVLDDMEKYIKDGRATTLKDAYDKAVWADPSIRQILQTKKQAENEAKQREREQKRLDKAKKSARNNLSKKGLPDAQVKPRRSIEETLSETYDRLHAEG